MMTKTGKPRGRTALMKMNQKKSMIAVMMGMLLLCCGFRNARAKIPGHVGIIGKVPKQAVVQIAAQSDQRPVDRKRSPRLLARFAASV
jgi:hypothetical protein